MGKHRKHRVGQVDVQDLWKIEAEVYIEQGMSPDSARTLMVNHWTGDGDLRPLAAAIRNHLFDGHELHPAILFLLIEMIESGQLVKSRKRGGTPKPEIFARDRVAFRLYEYGKKSEEEIATLLGMSQESVHGAIIKVRRTWWVK